MVDRISGAVIWLHLQYFELRWDRLVQDVSRERLDSVKVIVVGGLPIFHLKLGESAIDFLKLVFVVVKPSLLENSEGRTPQQA